MDFDRLSEADLAKLPPEALSFIRWQLKWTSTARPNQIPPATDWTECGFLAGRGFGKGLKLDTPIPTPTGWRENGDLRAGDFVFDEHGESRQIEVAHEPYLPERMYRLTFSDGTSLDADGDHLWTTWTHRNRKQYLRYDKPREFPENWATYAQPLYNSYGNVVAWDTVDTRSTEQLIETFTHAARKDTNHCIPTCGDLWYADVADLPMDPWVFGYWLGNGSTKGSTIACHHDDVDGVRARFEDSGFETRLLGTKRDFTAVALVTLLREMGVYDNKHAPEIYLRAPPEDRRALLAGLLDSDGHCDKASNHIEFCSTRIELAEAVVELARSLGQKPVMLTGRARLYGKDCGPKYRVNWRSTYQPFQLPRKAAAWREPEAQALRNRHRMIVGIEPIEPVLVRCLTVAGESALYLAGEGMIPTHNTRVGAEWLGRAVYEDPSGFPSCVICPTYSDVKFTAYEGESGLLSVVPPDLIVNYNKSDLTVEMKNITGGVSMIRGFSAEKPERLRGPQHCRGYLDEIAAWLYGEDTFDMYQMGLRLGEEPQTLWTTTPKPKDLIRMLTAPKEDRVIIRGKTDDNRANLPVKFFKQLEKYRGTRLGDQELDGLLIDPEEAGIVKRSQFRIWPHQTPLPSFEWIIVSLDTAFTEKTRARENDSENNTMKGDPDATACTVWGTFRHDKRMNVLLLDCWEDHLGLPELIRRTRKEMNQAYGDDADRPMVQPLIGPSHSSGFGRRPDVLLIEDKGSGISLRQMLEREGIIAFPYNPGRADKLTRLHVVSPVFARRLVWLPESEHPERKGKPKSWVEPMLAQICSFTGTGSIKHDDYVDAVTQTMRFLIDKQMLDVSLPQREQREREVEDRDRGFEREAKRGAYSNPYAA